MMTEEETKEFWEEYGFTGVHYVLDSPYALLYPLDLVGYLNDELIHIPASGIELLDFLFKYAVPKTRYCSLQFHGTIYVANVCMDFARHYVWSDIDPVEALSRALQEVIK